MLTLVVLFIQSCRSSKLTTTPEGVSTQTSEPEEAILVYPSATESTPLNSTPSTPSASPTPQMYDHSMFVESVAEDFEMVETEKPIHPPSQVVMNPSGTYQASEICDTGCYIYVEELSSGDVFVLTASSLDGNRGYSDLLWSDEAILEFMRVNQPHHGVRFIVNVETQEIIDAVPTPLE